jgi:hypothetical protein
MLRYHEKFTRTIFDFLLPATTNKSFTCEIMFLGASKYSINSVFEDKFLTKYKPSLERHQYASRTSSAKQGNKITMLCATVEQTHRGPTEIKGHERR